jgi:uncharacterized protein
MHLHHAFGSSTGPYLGPDWPRRLGMAALLGWVFLFPGEPQALVPDQTEPSWNAVVDHDPAELQAQGITPWAVLADLEVTSESIGPLRTVFTTAFSGAIQALDGQSVRLMGFLFPLEAAERHRRFLLTAYPPSCPYCLPAGPTAMVEVEAETPVPFSYDPIVLEGRFELLNDDPSGMYYRLHAARELAQ